MQYENLAIWPRNEGMTKFDKLRMNIEEPRKLKMLKQGLQLWNSNFYLH